MHRKMLRWYLAVVLMLRLGEWNEGIMSGWNTLNEDGMQLIVLR